MIMESKKQVELKFKRFKNFAEKSCKERNIDPQTIDFQEFDSTLNLEELKNEFDRRYNFEPNTERILQQVKEREEQVAKLNEFKAIDSLKNQKDTTYLDSIFHNLKEYIRMVSRKFIDSLFVIGSSGIGKSTCIIKTLAEDETEFIMRSGKITPKSLYRLLYDNRDGKVLVFDDTLALISDVDCMSLLYSSLWSATGVRTVHWDTTKKVDDLPTSFNFNSRVIFCINNIPDTDMMTVLLSRCIKYTLKMDYDIRLKLLYEIAKISYEKYKIEKKDIMMIMDFIKDNTDSSTKDFDLRLLHKVVSIFKYDKKNWKKLVKPLIKSNPEIILMKKLLGQYASIKQAQREWCQEVGKGRASFYRAKASITSIGR